MASNNDFEAGLDKALDKMPNRYATKQAIIQLHNKAVAVVLQRIKENASKDCDALNADYGKWLSTELNRELEQLTKGGE